MRFPSVVAFSWLRFPAESAYNHDCLFVEIPREEGEFLTTKNQNQKGKWEQKAGF